MAIKPTFPHDFDVRFQQCGAENVVLGLLKIFAIIAKMLRNMVDKSVLFELELLVY